MSTFMIKFKFSMNATKIDDVNLKKKLADFVKLFGPLRKPEL